MVEINDVYISKPGYVPAGTTSIAKGKEEENCLLTLAIQRKSTVQAEFLRRMALDPARLNFLQAFPALLSQGKRLSSKPFNRCKFIPSKSESFRSMSAIRMAGGGTWKYAR